MARERIQLVSDEVAQEVLLKHQIETGELNAKSFKQLPHNKQQLVHKMLFEMATEKVNPAQAAATLEFILFAFMKVMIAKTEGQSLSKEDEALYEKVKELVGKHEIGSVSPKKWSMNYVGYAEAKMETTLENRKAHLDRKKKLRGKK